MSKRFFVIFLLVIFVVNQFCVFADETDENEDYYDYELEETTEESTVYIEENSDEPFYKYTASESLEFDISKDFSATQGKRNWYYMTAPASCSYENEDYVMQSMYNVSRKCWGSFNMLESSVYADRMIPNSRWDAVLCFVAPVSGMVTISIPGGLRKGEGGGNGISYYINKENENLCRGDINSGDTSVKNIDDIEVSIKAGEKIYFGLNAKSEGSKDTVYMAPAVKYVQRFYNNKNELYTYNLTDAQKDTPVVKFLPNQKLNVNYDIVNDHVLENMNVTAAVYDANNKLVTIGTKKIQDEELQKDTIDGYVSIELPEKTDGLYIKVFFWEDNEFLRPMCDVTKQSSIEYADKEQLVQPIFDVYTYGAVADGKFDNTECIQKAIDDCHKNGKGTVLVYGGTFMTGQLNLKDNVTLHIAENTTLLGYTGEKTRAEAYPAVMSQGARRGVINAVDCENVTVEGKGSIDANCEVDNHVVGPPRTLRFYRSKNIRIKGVTLKNARTWVQAYDDCDNILLDGITVDSVKAYPSDGSDFVNCTNLTIQNCNIYADDDAIAIKSITYLHENVEYSEGNSEDWLFVEKLTPNYPIYIDDTKYTTSIVPEEIVECNWLRPSNKLRSIQDDILVSMNVTVDCYMYIALKDGDLKPEWLNEYKDSGLDIVLTNKTKFSLYVKPVKAGDKVLLGGNGNNASFQYIPILVPREHMHDVKYYDEQNAGAWKTVSQITTGDYVYADDDAKIVEMPQKYRKLPAFKPSANSNKFSGETLLEFDCAFPSNIFVLYDSNAEKLPQWLNDWSSEDEKIVCDDGSSYTIYKKYFDAGSTIKLNSVGESADKQYFVMLQPRLKNSANILIQNNFLNSRRNNGVALGTESWGGTENVRIINNRFGFVSKAGITVVSADGAIVKNIYADNNYLEEVGTPVFMVITKRNKSLTNVTGSIENVRITNLTATYCHERYGCMISGLDDRYIENVYLGNIRANFRAGITDGAKVEYNPPTDYYDMPKTNAYGILPGYAFYVRYAKNVVMDNVVVSKTENDIRKDWIVAEDTADVTINNCYDNDMNVIVPLDPPVIGGIDNKGLEKNRWNVCKDLSSGVKAYDGSEIVFTELPEYLNGADWLQPCADFNFSENEIISFCATHKGTVYVACTQDYDALSNDCFEGFVKTDDVVKLSDGTQRVLYKKDVDSGTLVHIGNNSDGDTKQNLVFFKVASLISNVKIYDTQNKDDWKVSYNLQKGDKIYGDRDFTFNKIPDSLKGNVWISPANDSKSYKSSSSVVSFSADEDVTVYVTYAQKAPNLPAWMSDWEATGETISILPNGVYNVYKKSFAKGSFVSLGCNETQSYNHYFVIVKPFTDEVDFISMNSANAFELTTNFRSGDTVINGDDKIFYPIPLTMLNSILLKPNAFVEYNSDNMASFTVAFDSDVYVVHQDSMLPEWLKDWSDIGETLYVGRSSTFKLFKKEYKAGEVVTLGKNGSNYTLPYMVFVQPVNPYYSYSIRR